MATWTNIGDTFLEPGKPARSVDALALRDNPIAIAQGASGAPAVLSAALQDYPWGGEDVRNGSVGAEKLQAGATEINWVLARTASAGTSAVGSYAFLATFGSFTTSAGGTRSGADLRYSSGAGDISGTPPGTWRCMGYVIGSNSASLWLRIA